MVKLLRIQTSRGWYFARTESHQSKQWKLCVFTKYGLSPSTAA